MRPFLKWAGGKNQILAEIVSRFPQEIFETKRISQYIEPFIGGGALFFYLMTKFEIEEAIIIDRNIDLIITYNTVRDELDCLIKQLQILEKLYLSLDNNERANLFLLERERFNKEKKSVIQKRKEMISVDLASRFIFLNRTCFNGLYRINSRGEFNVPHGRYKNPKIYDEKNLRDVSEALQRTKIIWSDYNELDKYARVGTLIYYDPPYRPISKTSSFTSYNLSKFGDGEQKRLAEFYRYIDKKRCYQILSNSDPKNENEDDDFFDLLFAEFYIDRIPAKRLINCNGEKRGKITELLIRNYRN
jgi:DNA adenine methylase